jgi:enamine deaminase RidA (YjgF/YER057c/UK114 family)
MKNNQPAGMARDSNTVPSTLEEEVAHAFANVNEVILYALEKSKHPAGNPSKTGWDFVTHIRSYHVNLAETRDTIIGLMVQHVKKWCPNHKPTWTMLGVPAMPFENQHVEIEVDVYLG